MNAQFPETPEVIGNVRSINNKGDEKYHGDRVVGINVESSNGVGIVRIDIRSFEKERSMIVAIELSEILQAIALAAMHTEK